MVFENVQGFLIGAPGELTPMETLKVELEKLQYAVRYVTLDLNAFHAVTRGRPALKLEHNLARMRERL